MEMLSCAITGHRPTRFKFKYNEKHTLCQKIKKSMLEVFRTLHDENGVTDFYVGGALGVDMWAAEILFSLCKQPGYENIKLIVAIPFENYYSGWDEHSKRRLLTIIRKASYCTTVGKEVGAVGYKRRNYFMVDHANFLLAVYDNNRKVRSGTGQTVNYALKKGRSIYFVNPDTAEITREV